MGRKSVISSSSSREEEERRGRERETARYSAGRWLWQIRSCRLLSGTGKGYCVEEGPENLATEGRLLRCPDEGGIV